MQQIQTVIPSSGFTEGVEGLVGLNSTHIKPSENGKATVSDGGKLDLKATEAVGIVSFFFLTILFWIRSHLEIMIF